MLAICLASCKEAVSVTGAEVNADGDLIITMSDGTTQNLGKVKGADSQIGASADNPQCLDFYPLPDGTYAVSLGNAIILETVAIPATYNGKAVTTVISGTKQTPPAVKTVTLPDSIVTIGKNAFSGYESLESINIPSGVTSIGDYAFFRCTALKSIAIPDSVTSIGTVAFEYCSSLESVTIPSGVTSIGKNAFNCCAGLESVTFIDSDGWTAGGTAIPTTDLQETDSAAALLTDTYRLYTWTKATE